MRVAESRDVFALPHGNGYLIYAPLAGRVIYGNQACIEQLRSYLQSGDESLVSPALQERLGGLHWLHTAPPVQPEPSLDRPYRPTYVTLFLTDRCNLGCLYCYADARPGPARTMPASVYQAAIDLVARNAAEADKPMGLGFHGGGEPTLAWEALTDAVDYARHRAGTRPLSLALATNGTARGARADYIAKTFTSITLSCDGPPDIQNRQRPYASGRGSARALSEFVTALHAHGTFFAVRVTVTPHNVTRLDEVIDYVADHLGGRFLHLEPCFPSGRAAARADLSVQPGQFAEAFVAAQDQAQRKQVRLRYSAARLYGIYSSFCGCAQDAFNVTADGEITACFEVCDRSSPLAERFFFGQYDAAQPAFRIDRAKLAELRSLTVERMPHCRHCIAKWSCAGDCPVKWGQGESWSGRSERCQMNQAITRRLLARTLEAGRCVSL